MILGSSEIRVEAAHFEKPHTQ